MALMDPLDMPERLEVNVGGRLYVSPFAHQLLTKCDLRTHFGVSDNRALLRKVFTSSVLEQIGMDVATWKSRKEFTLEESNSIYKALNIRWLRTAMRK